MGGGLPRLAAPERLADLFTSKMAKSKSKIPESRRDFMRLSIKRLARLGLSVRDSAAQLRQAAIEAQRRETPRPQPPRPLWLNQSPEMAYSRLGRTNLMMSRFAIGCARLGPAQADLLAEAVDAGVNFLAAAPNFGDSESALAAALPPIRDRVWVCTMMRPFEQNPSADEAEFDGDAPMAFWDSLEASLSRLKVDVIDCFMLQAIDAPWRLGDSVLLDAIDRAREQGKIRHAGVSTFRNVKLVVEAALKAEVFDVIETPVTPLNLSRVERSLTDLRDGQMGVVSTMTTAGIDDCPPGDEIVLHDLPEGLGAHDLVHLYTLKNALVAGCLVQAETREQLERLWPLALIEPGIIGGNELDAIVEEEIWPPCEKCGRRRNVGEEHLTALFEAEYSSYDPLMAGRQKPMAGELICEACLAPDGADAPPDDANADAEGGE